MKFSQILGDCDLELVKKSEQKLTATFMELATSYDNRNFGSRLGGDVFLHQIVSPARHICDARSVKIDEAIAQESDPIKKWKLEQTNKHLVRTASTDGQSFWWSPKFIVSKSTIGVRLVVCHEGGHVIYMHPMLRGNRNKVLWNISIDYKINYGIISDLRARKHQDPVGLFTQELGEFISLQEYLDFLKDPFNPPEKLSSWNPALALKHAINSEDNTQFPRKQFYYAEPNLKANVKRPEFIYDLIWSQTPKCPTCGKIGIWNKPNEYLKLEQEFKEKFNLPSSNDHAHS